MIGNDITNGIKNVASSIVNNTIHNIKDQLMPTITSTAPKAPFWAAGWDEVVMMNYVLTMGEISSLSSMGGDTMLAHTLSFQEGVSLSSISWGFVNSGVDAGMQSDAFLKFTLHDIAGTTFSNFIKIKSGAYIIYFYGPMSDGSFWPTGQPVVYQPIPDDCSLEFSPTEGFTYTVVASPMLVAVKSDTYMAPLDISIDGTYDGKDVAKSGNTFKAYIEELEYKWNQALDSEKKSTAKIIFDYADNTDGAQDKMWNRPANATEKVEGSAPDTTTNPIQPFLIKKGANLAKSLIALWQERFSTNVGCEGNTILEVNLKDYDGTKSNVNLKLHVGNITTDVSQDMGFPICIGDDVNCIGQPYRANLASLDFGRLTSILGAYIFSNAEGSTETSVASGNDSKTDNTCDTKEKDAENKTKLTKKGISNATGPAGTMQQPGFDAWAALKTVLNTVKTSEFSISVEMPYTFAFTPNAHGGLMKDAMEGSITGGIHYAQGCDLEFYWYTDPSCSTLEKNDIISTSYRIASVQHTIGISANTTQVKLSHLQITQ